MFDASLDDRTRHRLFRFPVAASMVSVSTASLRQYQPTSIARLQSAPADQQSQQQQ